VHDHHIVDVTVGPFENGTEAADPLSAAYLNIRDYQAQNAVDLDTSSCCRSFSHPDDDDDEYIPHTRNNWVCYDFKERRIMPTHYTILTHDSCPGSPHLKSWLVETSADGENWQEVAREEDNWQLNGENFIGTFTVAGGGESRFIRLVNIGENHAGSDCLLICAWEIFGTLFE
jgi:hypothetical protein